VLAAGLTAAEGTAWTQDKTSDDWDEGSDASALPVEIHGFVEGATATRVGDDPTQPDQLVVSEARFRLDLAHYGDRSDLVFRGDFLADGLISEGPDIDIRRAVVTLRTSSWLDVRAGRQVLTWGTGDLVFLNDLFPKDFVSFFIGRDDEYLKAPSNSIKLMFYTTFANFDIVWTPVFEPDRFIDGERLSFFDASLPGLTSASVMGHPLQVVTPEQDLDNSEAAARLYRSLGGYELAAYAYVGFGKQPQAFDPRRQMPAYARLGVYGGSLRGNLLGGIGNVEGAYYDATKDRDGDDPNRPNSQLRALAGYERELIANLTAGFQYYAEWVQDHDRLLAHSPAPEFEPDEVRQLLTSRLVYRLRRETLIPSIFVFVSPDDGDAHLRPSVAYKWSDTIAATAGANVMFGDDDTFFGQLENNTNAYLRVRYSF
jgi:hypothetical protein